ncbi:hypothetical protein D3C86_1003800 [compost metagenome]
MLVVGGQVQRGDLRAIGVDLALQRQRDRAFFPRQIGLAEQLITAFKIAGAGELQLIELQGVRQISTGLEAVSDDAHFGRQVFRQRLQFARQLPGEIAAAVGFQVQGFQQIAVNLQRQCPRRGSRQGQLALSGERPVSTGLQSTRQTQAQIVTLQFHRVDLHALFCPVRRQLQILELFAAIEQQAADLDVTQLQCYRQLQVWKSDRPAALLLRSGRELQADLLRLQLIDAQGHARQAQRRPGEDDFVQFNPAAVLLPQHMVGAPLPAQSTLKIVQAQTRHKAQRPTAASRRAEHRGQRHNQQHQQCRNRQQRYFQTAFQSSGPMEKCNRMPPSSSSAWARSRRIGPTGETQRTPIPTPVLRFGSSSVLKELP